MKDRSLRDKRLRLSALLIVLAFAVATAFFAFFIPRIRISGETEAFLPQGHTSVTTMKEIERIFGSQDFLTVIVTAKRDSIFTSQGLALLRDLTRAIERLPLVEEAMSISTMSHLQGTEEGMESLPLLPPEPYTAEVIQELKERLLSWDEYRRFLFSDDFRSTQIVIKPAAVQELTGGIGPGTDSQAMVELARQLKEIVDGHQLPGYRVLIAGEGIANLELLEGISKDLMLLLPGLLAVLVVILSFAFRSIRGVVLPLIGVLISNVWVIGIMALAGIPFTILGMVIPNLLMAVGSAYGIHMVNEQREVLREEPSSRGSRGHGEAIMAAWKRVSAPIILAALTTVAGFLALVASPLEPMKHMGIFTAVGVAVSALCTLFLLPALLMLVGADRRQPGRGSREIVPRILIRLYRRLGRSKAVAFSLILVVLIVSAFGISRITIGQPIIHFFRDKSEIRQADAFAGEHLSGTNILLVMVSGKPREGSIHPGTAGTAEADSPAAGSTLADDPFAELMDELEIDDPGAAAEAREPVGEEPKARTPETGRSSVLTPELLYELDQLGRYLETTFPEVVNVAGFSSLIKRMNQVMHVGIASAEQPLDREELADTLRRAMANAEMGELTGSQALAMILQELNVKGEQYYEVPMDPAKYGAEDSEGLRRLLAQYLLLYEGEIDGLLDRAVDPEHTLMTIQLDNGSPKTIKTVKTAILDFAEQRIGPLGYELIVSGNGEQALALSELVTRSQLLSIAFALGFVLLAIALTYRSLVAGLITLVPIALTVLFNFGFMGLVGFPLDIVTAMIAAIAIGIGIDYSIHFLSGYIREFRGCHDHHQAAEQTVRGTGKAIAYNALSVSAGFVVLVLSVFTPLNTVGIMMSLTMASSSILAVTILPFLVGLLPQHIRERLTAVHSQRARTRSKKTLAEVAQ